MSSLVTVCTYPSRVEADIAKGLLETNGIKAILAADDAGGSYPMMGMLGVKLQVNSEDFKKAKKLLEISL